MNLSEEFALAAIIVAPMAILAIIAMIRGYNVHFTKHRILEQEKKDDKKQ